MQNFSNIEKSATRSGKYIGYAQGAVYYIRRPLLGRDWVAVRHVQGVIDTPATFRGATLKAINEKLSSFSKADK